jgi:hypothetical protein
MLRLREHPEFNGGYRASQKPARMGRRKCLISRRRNRPVLPFQKQVLLGGDGRHPFPPQRRSLTPTSSPTTVRSWERRWRMMFRTAAPMRRRCSENRNRSRQSRRSGRSHRSRSKEKILVWVSSQKAGAWNPRLSVRFILFSELVPRAQRGY